LRVTLKSQPRDVFLPKSKYGCEIEETADGCRCRPFRETWGHSRASLKGASRQMARSMSEEQLEDFVQPKRKNLPTKKRNCDPDPSSKSGRDRKISSGKSKDR